MKNPDRQMINKVSIKTKYNMRGISMVEVLVAIVVLSIGLLGLAGLQATSLRNNNSAYQRTQANILANEILDRMRANQAGIEAGAYNNPGTPNDPNCVTAGCTPATMAQYDVFEWNRNLAATLPSGQGTIAGNGANSVFTITVMWDDERTGATGTNCGGNPAVDLTCFVLSTRL